jgi:hypothetical protein
MRIDDVVADLELDVLDGRGLEILQELLVRIRNGVLLGQAGPARGCGVGCQVGGATSAGSDPRG